MGAVPKVLHQRRRFSPNLLPSPIARPEVPHRVLPVSLPFDQALADKFIDDEDSLTKHEKHTLISLGGFPKSDKEGVYYQPAQLSSDRSYINNLRTYISQLHGRAAINNVYEVFQVIQNAFGKLASTISATHLQGSDPDAGSASSDLFQLIHCRIVTCVEPSMTKKLKTSFIKLIYGGDAMWVRQLYDNAVQMIPAFHIILQCNSLPLLDATEWYVVGVFSLSY